MTHRLRGPKPLTTTPGFWNSGMALFQVVSQVMDKRPTLRRLAYASLVLSSAAALTWGCWQWVLPTPYAVVLTYTVQDNTPLSSETSLAHHAKPLPTFDSQTKAFLYDAVDFLYHTSLPRLLHIDDQQKLPKHWTTALKTSRVVLDTAIDDQRQQPTLLVTLQSYDSGRLQTTARQFDSLFLSGLNQVQDTALTDQQQQIQARYAQTQTELALVNEQLQRQPKPVIEAPDEPKSTITKLIRSKPSAAHQALVQQHQKLLKQLESLEVAIARDQSKQRYFQNLLRYHDTAVVEKVILGKASPGASKQVLQPVLDEKTAPAPPKSAKETALSELPAHLQTTLQPSSTAIGPQKPSNSTGSSPTKVVLDDSAKASLVNDLITTTMSLRANQNTYQVLMKRKETLLSQMDATPATTTEVVEAKTPSKKNPSKPKQLKGVDLQTKQQLLQDSLNQLENQLLYLDHQQHRSQFQLQRLGAFPPITPTGHKPQVPWHLYLATFTAFSLFLGTIPYALEQRRLCKPLESSDHWIVQHAKYFARHSSRAAGQPRPIYLLMPINPAQYTPMALYLCAQLQRFNCSALAVDLDFQHRRLSSALDQNQSDPAPLFTPMLSGKPQSFGLLHRLRYQHRELPPAAQEALSRPPATQVVPLETTLTESESHHLPKIIKALPSLLEQWQSSTLFLDCPTWHPAFEALLPMVAGVLFYSPTSDKYVETLLPAYLEEQFNIPVTLLRAPQAH